MTERLIFKKKLYDVSTVIRLPKTAKILHIGDQFNEAFLWYEFEVNDPDRDAREFRVVATGEHFDFEGKHVATISQQDGKFIWHIYEVSSNKPAGVTDKMIKERHAELTGPGSFYADIKRKESTGKGRFIYQNYMTLEEELDYVAKTFKGAP